MAISHFLITFAVLYDKTDILMEIDIIYKAKDGTEFSDPLICEEYEKSLDTLPGTLGYFLRQLDQFEESDLFTGTMMYKEKDKQVTFYMSVNMDFSDIYEGEIVTQAMKEAQRRATSTVAGVRRHFNGIDLSTPCGGTFVVSKRSDGQPVMGISIPCDPVFEAANKQKR